MVLESSLQAHDDLTGAHATCDLLLRPARAIVARPDTDQLRVATRPAEDGLRYALVMEDRIGLLQEPRGLQRQKVGIARSGANDVCDSARRPCMPRCIKVAEDSPTRTRVVAGQSKMASRSVDDSSPKGAPCRRVTDQVLHLDRKSV
ncbi:MAG TPA: hypothetical protein VJQ81_15155, partial [Reyranella sp.]|nr:hypothetical protein [Reyranella sp.]